MGRGRAPLLKNGLTQKQNKFKDVILDQIKSGKQINATEAAAIAYEPKNRATAGAIAGENLRNPTIKKTIAEELESVGATPLQLAHELRKLAVAVPDKIDASTKLKAITEILKLTGHYKAEESHSFSFTFNQQVNNLTFKEIEEELATMRATNEDLVTEAKPLQDTP